MNLALLDKYDREFLGLCSDPDLRRAEIARLRRIRGNYFVASILLFVLAAAGTFFLHSSHSLLWLVVFAELFAFYEVHFRLRLLLLSEQRVQPEKRDGESNTII